VREEVQREIERLGIKNDPTPETCSECGAELLQGSGMVGESILYCKDHGIKWEDSEDAIEIVF